MRIKKSINRLLGVALVLLLTITGCFQTVFATQAPETNIEIRIEPLRETVGNIYYVDGSKPDFYVEVKNKADEAEYVTLDYAVNNGEDQIWTSSLAFTVEANSTVSKAVRAEIGDVVGEFTFSVAACGDFTTVQREYPFVYGIANNTYADDMGLHCHFGFGGSESVDDSVDLIKNAGYGWIRAQIQWKDVETIAGKHVVPEFAEKFVNELIKNGNKVVLNLDKLSILSYNKLTIKSA